MAWHSLALAFMGVQFSVLVAHYVWVLVVALLLRPGSGMQAVAWPAVFSYSLGTHL